MRLAEWWADLVYARRERRLDRLMGKLGTTHLMEHALDARVRHIVTRTDVASLFLGRFPKDGLTMTVNLRDEVGCWNVALLVTPSPAGDVDRDGYDTGEVILYDLRGWDRVLSPEEINAVAGVPGASMEVA